MFAERSTLVLLLPVIFLCCSVTALAQEPTSAPAPTAQPTPLTAPPPLRTIPKQEHSQIDGASDPKTRVRITLEFADEHLKTAETYTTQSNFEAASHEVGTYHALIQNVLTY